MDISNLLIQLPLVGIFAWYVTKNNQDSRKHQEKNNELWRQYLSERNGKTETALNVQAKSLEKLTRMIVWHISTKEGMTDKQKEEALKIINERE